MDKRYGEELRKKLIEVDELVGVDKIEKEKLKAELIKERNEV